MLRLISGGRHYREGVHFDVPLCPTKAGVLGCGLRAHVRVVAGQVVELRVSQGGQAYKVGDTFSSTQLGDGDGFVAEAITVYRPAARSMLAASQEE